MAFIETDNAALEKRLLDLIDLIEEGGGATHSNLLIRAQGGGLSVSTQAPMTDGREIIRLARGILLPSDQYTMRISNDAFTLEIPDNSLLSDLQKRLIACMVDIYNETDKARSHKKYSFAAAVSDYPLVVEYLNRGRTFSEEYKTWASGRFKDLDKESLDALWADSFLKTRHLGYTDHLRMGNVSVLMPVIDFLNHHWNGASFSVGQGLRPGDLIITNKQSISDTGECFAFYGPMDALDTLVRYDFMDAGAPVVRSIPLEFDMLQGWKLKVSSVTGAMNAKHLPKQYEDLRRYIPIMSIDKENKIFTVSHLFIPIEGSPNALRRSLGAAMWSLQQQGDGIQVPEGFTKEWTETLEREVLRQNVEYYQELPVVLDKAVQGSGSDHFVLNSLRDLARVQLDKLKRYKPTGHGAEAVSEAKTA
jgi:hypothetical protein